MRRAHLRVGWVVLVVFVGTGVFLRLRMEGLVEAGGESVRYAIRANHVYLLMSGLVNLAMGGAMGARRGGTTGEGRRRAAAVGEMMVMIAPAVLLAAFVVEGPHPAPVRPLTSAGVVMLALGTVLVVGVRRGGK